MVVNFQDRVVQYPLRVKLNQVIGQADTYDLEKIPGTITNAGTPLNAANLNSIGQEIVSLSDDFTNQIRKQRMGAM